MDQDSSQHGTLSTTFDLPGVYLFVCKVHPYMTGVVAVREAQGSIPPVTAGQPSVRSAMADRRRGVHAPSHRVRLN